MSDKTLITVETTVKSPVEKVWSYWNEPEHIVKWNTASDDWHTPRATADLREGGAFSSRMEAKDGSAGFDFGGVFTKVVPEKKLEYTLGDGRTVSITFEQEGDAVHITETFQAETQNPPEFQKQGWQAILDNFRKYAEARA